MAPTAHYVRNPAGYSGVVGFRRASGLTESGLPIDIEIDGSSGGDRKTLELECLLLNIFFRTYRRQPSVPV